MKVKLIFSYLCFLYFIFIQQIFAQFTGGSNDGFNVYTTATSSTLNGIAIDYVKFTGGFYDGYAFVEGLLSQLDGKHISTVKYAGGEDDGYDYWASIFYMSGKSVMYYAYLGGAFDGFDVYTPTTSSTLNGITIDYVKFTGGFYDGYAFIEGLLSQLDGKQISTVKYAGGEDDGYDYWASIFYMSGKSVMYYAYLGGSNDGYVSSVSLSDISLPVILTSFSLSEIQQQTAVEIKWQTESEIDINHWLLLRKSENDSAFAKLKKITGQGNSSATKEYTYVDVKVEAGNNYIYQLADVSINGQINYHEEKSITVSIPPRFKLYQNYPNPFNPSTKIKYSLPKTENVKIEIYNVIGQKIETLINKPVLAGYHEVEFNAQKLSSGVYLYHIQAGDFNQVRKMVLLR